MPTYDTYTPSFKQHVLEEYRPNQRDFGFKSLAKKWKIRSCGILVKFCYQQWDGTQQSLIAQPRSHKQRKLSLKDSRQYVLLPVLKTIEKRRAISYVDRHKNLQKEQPHLDNTTAMLIWLIFFQYMLLE
jgi:hypothetical protein